MNIAIAEDEAEIRQFFKSALLRLGHQVVAEAQNGRELIEQCRVRCPDLIITDIQMPETDGIEATRRIMQESPCPILALTASDATNRGAIFDVLVDCRPESPTYTRWFGLELSADNSKMLFIPEGCGHGYQTLVDATEIYYMTSAFFSPEAVRGARFDDEVFGISWPLRVSEISDQDRGWAPFVREDQGG